MSRYSNSRNWHRWLLRFQDPAFYEPNYRVMSLRWTNEPEVQVFSTADDTDELERALREELDIEDTVEKISVVDNGRHVNFIHDFASNVTGEWFHYINRIRIKTFLGLWINSISAMLRERCKNMTEKNYEIIHKYIAIYLSFYKFHVPTLFSCSSLSSCLSIISSDTHFISSVYLNMAQSCTAHMNGKKHSS